MSQAAQASPKMQWMLGVSGGYIIQSAKLTGSMNYTHNALPPGFFTTYYKHELFDNSYLGGILGGLQFSCNDWLLGLELSGDWQSLNQKREFSQTDLFNVRGWGATSQYDKGASVSLSVRWGYQVTPYLMPYMRLGLETSRDKLNVSFHGTPDYPGSYETTDKKQMYRFLAGFGAESMLPCFPCLKLRLEYNYLSRGQRLESQGLIIDGLTNPFFDNESLPKYHLWKLALVWYFS